MVTGRHVTWVGVGEQHRRVGCHHHFEFAATTTSSSSPSRVGSSPSRVEFEFENRGSQARQKPAGSCVHSDPSPRRQSSPRASPLPAPLTWDLSASGKGVATLSGSFRGLQLNGCVRCFGPSCIPKGLQTGVANPTATETTARRPPAFLNSCQSPRYSKRDCSSMHHGAA
ncbi:hypothetical protein E2P81_ATG02392 [Venturia nashicola]|uniref:Uncharacterized protein n=1 Tax=Venturia nashicola TaxID=86259 RepID=A0A4Z1P860_9PEZI|nr:hypothetical protein E6O75_ATG02453 [Venturia nashicola]TLD36610.1 hypothetical protein E2P81_ATG02392 [Venturia nashicola]